MKLETFLLLLVSRAGAVNLSVNGEVIFDLKTSNSSRHRAPALFFEGREKAVLEGQQRSETAAPVLECQYQYPEREQIDAILSNMMNELTKVFVRAHDFFANDKKQHPETNEETKIKDEEKPIEEEKSKEERKQFTKKSKYVTNNSDEVMRLLMNNMEGKRRAIVKISEEVTKQTDANKDAKQHGVSNEYNLNNDNMEKNSLSEAYKKDKKIVKDNEKTQTNNSGEADADISNEELNKYKKEKSNKANPNKKEENIVGTNEKNKSENSKEAKKQTDTHEKDKLHGASNEKVLKKRNKKNITQADANEKNKKLLETDEENKTKQDGKHHETDTDEKYNNDKPLKEINEDDKHPPKTKDRSKHSHEAKTSTEESQSRNKTKAKHKKLKIRPHETRFKIVNAKKTQFFEHIYHNMTKEYDKFYNNTAQRVDRAGSNPCQHQEEIKQIWRSLLDNSLAIFRRAALRCVQEHLKIQKNDERDKKRLGQFLMRELAKVRTNHLHLLCDHFQLCFNELQQ